MMDDDGYDPACSELFDDSEIAYQPSYVPSGHFEDSLDDLSSDDDDRDLLSEVDDPSIRRRRQLSPTHTPKYDPGDRTPISSYSGCPQASIPVREEYQVQPLDVLTPAYAPSQTFGSPSESSEASSVSGGYPSPLSSIQPSILANEGQNRFYHAPYKPEVSESPASDVSIPQPNASVPLLLSGPSSPIESPPLNEIDASDRSPNQLVDTRDMFDEFDVEDADDDNKLNEDFEGFERDEQPESQVDGIIADIFGESDAEEEFEGFAENEVEEEIEVEHTEEPPLEETVDKHGLQSDDDNDEGSETVEDAFVSDFDQIMSRKRQELNRKRRRNRDIEFLNDSDDLIMAMISRMKQAAEEDRRLLSENRPATKKLKMVSEVTSLLRRADLKSALIENGMLSAITDWLAPLPGHTLPNLVIRDAMLSCLREFQSLSPEVLQDSGIGKALMYLYKHPLETRDNKDRAGRLINEWLRPIFNLTSDYRTLTKEERKQLDYEHLPKRRNIEQETYDHRDINRELDGEARGLLRPGDPGWVGRARVPQPSNKDYIVRPKWRVSSDNRSGDDNGDEDGEEGEQSENRAVFRRKRKPAPSGGFGATSRIESHIRNLTAIARQKHTKAPRAVVMSIEGRKMAL